MSRFGFAEPNPKPSGHRTLGNLLARFADSPGLSANFTEEKRIALLNKPINNSGRLYFARPGLFARHIDKPFRSAMFLRDRKIILWDGDGTREVDLDANPAVAALATSFLSLLEGNLKILEANYQVRFDAELDDAWALRLEPKRDDLKRLIQKLSFSGRGLTIATMELVEASGDTSKTSFFNSNTHRVFSAEEKQRYFTPPKK